MRGRWSHDGGRRTGEGGLMRRVGGGEGGCHVSGALDVGPHICRRTKHPLHLQVKDPFIHVFQCEAAQKQRNVGFAMSAVLVYLFTLTVAMHQVIPSRILTL